MPSIMEDDLERESSWERLLGGPRREHAHHPSLPEVFWELEDVVNTIAAPVRFCCRILWRSAGFLYPGRDGCHDGI